MAGRSAGIKKPLREGAGREAGLQFLKRPGRPSDCLVRRRAAMPFDGHLAPVRGLPDVGLHRNNLLSRLSLGHRTHLLFALVASAFTATEQKLGRPGKGTVRGSKPPYLRRAHTVRRAESDGAAPCRIKKSRGGADPDGGNLRKGESCAVRSKAHHPNLWKCKRELGCMELSRLRNSLLSIFNAEAVDAIPDLMLQAVMRQDDRLFHDVKEILPNLSHDWFRGIFQYYLADRDEMKQDFTPDSLAILMARLTGDSDTIVDLCAGSGSLSIAAWSIDQDRKFECFELDARVIPFLLFNLAIRNMNAIVHHADVLREVEFSTYAVVAGEKFSHVEVVTHGDESMFKQSAVQPKMAKATNGGQCSLFSM